jgi:hypothetical protein
VNGQAAAPLADHVGDDSITYARAPAGCRRLSWLSGVLKPRRSLRPHTAPSPEEREMIELDRAMRRFFGASFAS